MSCVDSEILVGAYRQLALKTRKPDLGAFAMQPRVQEWVTTHPDFTPNDLLRDAINLALMTILD